MKSERATSVVDELYAALAKGDVDAMRACFTPDAVIWHCYDSIPAGLDSAVSDWANLIGQFAERRITDVRRYVTDVAIIQQHLVVLGTGTGERYAWPVCIVVTLSGERICRLDEYIDRAGSFTPPPGLEPRTPGL